MKAESAGGKKVFLISYNDAFMKKRQYQEEMGINFLLNLELRKSGKE